MTTDEMCLEAIKRGVWVVDFKEGSVYSIQAHRPLGCKNLKGYQVATLHLNGERKQVKLHRVIWIARNGIPPLGKVIDHINRKKDDNRIVNLRLANPVLNSSNRRSYKGENNPSAKINSYIVACIRNNNKKESYSELAKRFNVSKTLVAKIMRKEIWNQN